MKSLQKFTGKTVMIIGFGTIGLPTGVLHAAHGASRVILTRSKAADVDGTVAAFRAKLAEEQIDVPELIGLDLDVTSADSRAAAIARLGEIIPNGGLHAVVITAGGINTKARQTMRLAEEPPMSADPATARQRWQDLAGEIVAERQRIFESNCSGPLNFLYQLTPLIINRPEACCVTTICSCAPLRILSGVAVYSEAKAALLTGTQSWAADVARSRVALKLPAHRGVPIVWGWSIGDQNRKVLLDEAGLPKFRFQRILANHPMGEVGSVEQIADTILYANTNAYCTLEPLVVAGGAATWGQI